MLPIYNSSNSNTLVVREQASVCKKVTHLGSQLKSWAKEIKRDLTALTIALKDPRCPRSAQFVAAATIMYALSPIDLIPDFIPVLGQLDDIIIVPLGIVAAVKLMPKEVWEDAQREAEGKGKPAKNSYVVAAAIVGLYLFSGYKLAHYWEII